MQALSILSLSPSRLLTFTSWEQLLTREKMKGRKRNRSDMREITPLKRTTYCIMKFPGNAYECPVHSIISQYRNSNHKHKINWLRVSMVYKRHANLNEILLGLGDLNGKVMEHSKDTATKQLICNCRADTKVHGKCIYNVTVTAKRPE